MLLIMCVGLREMGMVRTTYWELSKPEGETVRQFSVPYPSSLHLKSGSGNGHERCHVMHCHFWSAEGRVVHDQQQQVGRKVA